LLPAAFLPHRDPQLHMGVPDIAVEFVLIGLAQDGLLVRIGQLAEQEHVRRRAPDRVDRRIAVAGLDGIRLRLILP
jgi:hypothetical protein